MLKQVREIPLLVKLSPDLDETALENSIRVIKEFSIQGVIVANTTVKRPELKSKHRFENGGLSGKPLQKRSTEMIRNDVSEIRNRNADYRCGWDFQWSRCI